MPLFVISCIDKAGALETRLATRPAHLEHLASQPGVKLAGPYLDEKGDPAGTLIIVEAEQIGAARDICDQDPYVKAGVFDRVEIHPFRLTIGSL